MAKLSPINFIIGLPTNFIANGRQKKFKVDVSKNVAKIANIWSNSVIFHPILMFVF